VKGSLITILASFLGAVIGVTVVAAVMGQGADGAWTIGGAVVGALAFSAPFRGKSGR
jgi:hypothetical protein